MRLRRLTAWAILLVWASGPVPAVAQNAAARIDEALQNITTLVRDGRIGYATAWEGNAFVQCRRMPDRQMRCESAGTALQPSLRNVLTDERIKRLIALGWALDSSFGNYTRTFSAAEPTAAIAGQIEQILREAYAADLGSFGLSTRWVADVPCPPRVGRSQNLAGSVNDMPSMRSVVVHSCSHAPERPVPQTVSSAKQLVSLYGSVVTSELQRLRINVKRRIYAVFDIGIGYVQCMPETSPAAILCEAQSMESWPALAALLTPKRIARLHAAGFADPGRTPNYWKVYSLDKFTDATIASELLTILHDVYNYTGAIKLKVKTEQNK